MVYFNWLIVEDWERRGLEWAVHTFDARYHSSVHTQTLINTHVHTCLHSAMRSW